MFYCFFVVVETHKLVKYDRPFECSPEKDCCDITDSLLNAD